MLNHIKESARGKSAAELAQLRKDIAEHIRGLEPFVAAEQLDGVGEMTARFGQGGVDAEPQGASNQVARLERHRAELAYLDELLRSADPILAAQAAAQ
jgi:hypothetical protein